MAYWFSRSILGIVATVSLTAAATVILTMLWVREQPTAGQTDVYRAPRTADGAPDLNGVWQALNTANWDLQDHAARPSPVVAMGARGAIPAGQADRCVGKRHVSSDLVGTERCAGLKWHGLRDGDALGEFLEPVEDQRHVAGEGVGQLARRRAPR